MNVSGSETIDTRCYYEDEVEVQESELSIVCISGGERALFAPPRTHALFAYVAIYTITEVGT